MSELLLLIAGGRRCIERCGRLAREYRYSLFQVSSHHKVREASSKLLCSVPLVTRTIPRQSTWWNSLRVFSSRTQEQNYASVIPLAGVHGSARDASNVPERDTLAICNNERDVFRTVEQKKDKAAQASACLQRLLGITAEEADLSVNENRGFSLTDPDDISHNYEACLDAGFSETAIKQNPEILSHPREILGVKIQLVASMNIVPFDDAIPFLKLGVSGLNYFSDKLMLEAIENEGVNRITYLTEQLQCAKLPVCEILARHHFMRTLEFPKLKQVLKIMLDAHINKEDILNDPWGFRYSPATITERLKRVTDAGVHPVKPWMIRCPEVALSKRIRKELGRRSVLGDRGTIVEYLSQRLQCDTEAITAFIDKHPQVGQVSGPKMKRVIDFLLENGYTIDHMMRSPRVFFRRLETIQERLKELREYRYKPKNLSLICKSERQYNDFLQTVKLKWLRANTK